MTSATKLNPVQHHLLSLFDKGMSDKELADIQQLLVKYYQDKIELETDAFWEENGYTTASFQKDTADLHLKASLL